MPKNLQGHVTLATPPFGNIFWAASSLSRWAPLAAFRYCCYLCKTFVCSFFDGESIDDDDDEGADVQTVPGNMHVSFEVRS